MAIDKLRNDSVKGQITFVTKSITIKNRAELTRSEMRRSIREDVGNVSSMVVPGALSMSRFRKSS